MIPPFISGPIMAGLCTLEACKTTLTLNDLWALNETMLVMYENDRRAHEAAERKAKLKHGR